DERAVVGAFLDHDIVEAVGIGIDGRGAHAARGAFAANDQAVDAFLLQMRDQRRAEERRGALLVDHELARRRRKLDLDDVGVVRFAADVAVGRMYAARVDVAGGVDYGGAACGRKERLRRRHRLPGVFAARAGEFPVDFFHWTVAAAIGLVVEVDGEHRRVVSDINLAAIGLVDLDGVGVDDVLPAMIFEIARHDVLLYERRSANGKRSIRHSHSNCYSIRTFLVKS